MIEHALEFQADSFIVEDKGSGTSLIQDLSRTNITGLPYPIAFSPDSDKVTRMHAQSAKIEAGHVRLPRRSEWLADLRAELLQFPKGRYDDQVDSISQFLNWLERRELNGWSVQEFLV